MNKRSWGGGVVALVAAAGMVVTALSATAETGTTPAPGNTCANPLLASAISGWGILRGTSQQRVALPAGDHPAAGHAYQLEARAGNQWNGNLSFYLPQQRVVPGEKWEFAVDQRIDTFGADPGGRARMEVDWYAADGAYLGQHAGTWLPLTAGSPADWARIATTATAPSNAARANVLTDLELGSGSRVLWAGTACDYRKDPGSSTPTPPTPTPPGDQTSAAVKLNWGTPHGSSDEFNYVGVPDPAKWSLPSGSDNQGNKPGCWNGHNGNGWRCEANSRADGNVLVMTGEANGETGWLRSKHSADYGRWEVRSRSRNVGTSGGLYHVLHLLWPSSERWPEDGEYDWLEYTNPDANCAEAWLHYPHVAGISTQQEHAEKCPVDMKQWHNFAFEWTPQHVKGFIDGVPWFTYANGANSQRRNMQDMQPFGRYTMQLDNFTGDGGLRPAVFEMDSYRYYPLR